jgi:hypothetical protein
MPINGQAARVARPGVHWEPLKKIVLDTAVHSDTPLPVREFIGPRRDNLAGRVVCRLRVVGLAAEKNSQDKPRWVVRCACGSYGHRSTKYLKSEMALTHGMCRRCDYLEALKDGAPWLSESAT